MSDSDKAAPTPSPEPKLNYTVQPGENAKDYLNLLTTIEADGKPFIHVNITSSIGRDLTRDEISFIVKMFLTNVGSILLDHNQVMVTQLNTIKLIRDMQ